MRVTINDIAKRAGVSKTTVSFAFNKPERISRKTFEHIMAIAGEVGYIPDPVAKTLTTKKIGSIGFLIPQPFETVFKNPSLLQTLQGIGEVCQKYNLSITIVPPKSGCIFQGIRSAAVDGFITLGLEDRMKTVALLKQRHIPFVSIDGESSGDIANVCVDDARGAYEAMRYILGRGHTRIAILSFSSEGRLDREEFSSVTEKRLEGYRQALVEAHIDPDTSAVTIIPCECSIDGGFDSARQALSVSQPPTAIITMSDIVAHGVYLYCQENNIRIPDDLSVIGFDDIPQSILLNPPLTTVRQPAYEKGKMACELLFDIINKKNVQRHALLPTLFIERRSAGAVRNGVEKQLLPF